MSMSRGSLLAARILTRLRAPLAAVPLGGGRHCVMCGNRVGRFLPYEWGWRGAPPLMRALDMVGSDLDHFECPRCGAHDRERHLLLYMREAGLLPGLHGKVVIHFAPEAHLSRRIADDEPAEYVKCDLFPTAPDVRREDLLAMTFPSDYADVVIANHVLEHVSDDRKAVAEIRRVLKPGGVAILQTPFAAALERTWEDARITTDDARLQAYGQSDHVRLFGRDIVDRIAACGLEPQVRTHEDLLADVLPSQVGVNSREPFLMFTRPRDASRTRR